MRRLIDILIWPDKFGRKQYITISRASDVAEMKSTIPRQGIPSEKHTDHKDGRQARPPRAVRSRRKMARRRRFVRVA
jgi:hypothetical protein